MTAKHRWIELGKTLLILLLSVSALYLLGRTQLFDQATGAGQGWMVALGFAEESASQLAGTGGQVAVIRPVRVVLTSSEGRHGSQYSNDSVDALYSKVPNLLADALQRAESPAKITESQWQTALGQLTPGIYLDLLGSVPFSVLASSVGGGSTDTSLSAHVQQLLLTTDDRGSATLYYQDERDGSYYRCSIQMGGDLAERLAEQVSDYAPNGISFAFEQEEGYQALDPYTLIQQHEDTALSAYDAVNPIPISDDDSISTLLQDLGFHYQSSQIVGSAESLSVREGSNDSLRVYNTGQVVYHAATAEESRFPVASMGESASELEVVESVWVLLEQVTGTRRGEARIYLDSLEETADGWQLTFGYQLEGAQVLVGSGGYAAQVVVSRDYVVDIDLQLREYSLSQTSATPVLPLTQTLAAMEALEVAGGTLRLCYLDSGAGWVTAEWVVNSGELRVES